ncbi:hypothetical protein CW676_03305 [Macrococcoides caseolyticum]|uniref:hypothetical protein n=1 Tax=Macrococcoides caseolyticum TaxID=69966 RepID=UPI000C3449BE|nr:hypothetical protein [Macrococcus caseolyticus]PKE07201.1 hypothetical protein CW692_04140 [Macrococcus caseolyticus]PKE24639.1 hypothetical protein CW689_02855 [Macrococcus caseolyticus]PKE44123.1 hypothetical protein CW666_05865 [Macrococcus caseolyticus]PKE53902.1 hypothetical protein CW676_03305 [Macrococcus caseolyticus]PKF39024.1 hypothetical protein CW681_03635 [Macrococcus caseolyticus]
MSKVVKLPTPTHANTVTDVEQIKLFTPQYAQAKTLPKLYDVSRTTIYRLLKQAKQLGYTDIEVSVSQTCTLVHIENFNKFLRDIDGKHY